MTFALFGCLVLFYACKECWLGSDGRLRCLPAAWSCWGLPVRPREGQEEAPVLSHGSLISWFCSMVMIGDSFNEGSLEEDATDSNG